MLILTLRTDKPEAEIGLFQDDQQLTYETWQAHRELAETIHLKIRDVLQAKEKTIHDVEAVAIYQGPGSFTGLRIGITVANALAGGLRVPIIGTPGEDWLKSSLDKLAQGQNDQLVLPEYGADVHITLPKH